MMIFAFALALQPADRLPLADPASSEASVLAPINEAFRALEAQDSAALLRVVDPDGRVTAVGKLPDGTAARRSRSWTEYASKMRPGHGFKERIINPMIEVDGDVALVWAPFTIEVGGKIVSCGTDHFDMVRQGGAWKIMNITFSTMSTGCLGQ
ncbi:nuclear transport factor 2 family protein [Sphingomonas sp. SM33]|uniref:Nuclear transport factor 2 family protein n=1 Tax=Sphingomonas telluris TaxID=2907998 RepID=A0ABS9VL55_9SPHN|nr:nuclear transport factor 2 family protein [Sphingomonas telluris]MCH8615700.1 nuclear transport factor 2 family protein [Sphingomonas telluris]